MAKRRVFLTEKDARRLERNLRAAMVQNWMDALALKTLDAQLQRVHILSANEVMPNVVTTQSCVRIRDLATREVVEVTLGWPEDADPENGRVSVVSPVGAALLGHATGDIVNLRTSDGLRRIRIEEITWDAEPAEGREFSGAFVGAGVSREG